MNAYLNLEVRELATGWKPATIAKVEKLKKTYFLKDLAGNVLAKSTSLDTVAAAGRRYAEAQGYIHSGTYAAAV